MYIRPWDLLFRAVSDIFLALLNQRIHSYMLRRAYTNQVTRKQGVVYLCLLLIALVFSAVSSINMTLTNLSSSMYTSSQMVMADHHDVVTGEHTDMSDHCSMDGNSHCQMSHDGGHSQTCSEAHCSTMPVLVTQFEAPTVHHNPVHNGFEPSMALSSLPSSPYIPPIAA